MASQSFLGLPPISTELKSIRPYLQRAEEVKSQDPVISYWCTYYAAQIGISLKVKDHPSREFLFAILGLLEDLKKEIGPNEAIDNETVSAAYVENFALRLFVNADNEDRSGAATRNTAKKFLAAANFLEIMKTFPKTELSDSHDERVRYAKWKAADIAKAFREGRRPTPGPANVDQGVDPSLHPPQNQYIPQQLGDTQDTPPEFPSSEHHHASPEINPSGGHQGIARIPPKAWDSGEPESPPTGILPTQAVSPDFALDSNQSFLPPTAAIAPIDDVSVPDSGSSMPQPCQLDESGQGQDQFHANRFPSFTPSASRIETLQGQSRSTPSRDLHVAPPFSQTVSSPVQETPLELTVEIIAKTQKHCRFAISALDYDDAETARKELRAALALLGG
ncbi:hypothetical protein AX16_000288 [Volvariella volvacea WC 439]|nr:hypothetical protein AX16_000288 [Volvariella volvacea WC 439]